MRRTARIWVPVVALFLLASIAAIAMAGRNRSSDVAPRPEGSRPALMLVTSLPLLFSEDFTLDAVGTKALSALESRYRLVPIGTTDARSLRQAALLLMAHPLAQPAEDLVSLDRWVRGGGRVLILADPMLEWPSRRPLGDKLRPPPAFADTGLLAHWGLRLEAPRKGGPRQLELAGRSVRTSSPGSLAGGCHIAGQGLVAHCRVGKGEATIIADADFLNVEALDGPAQGNLDALLAELASLER